MEHIISIPITPPDQDALVPQVGFALEQLRELASRRKHPKLWALSDKLCPLPQDSYGVIQKRRKRRRALGLMNWMLGAFGTLIVLMPPEMPFSVIAAASICLGGGVAFLWRYWRTVLGVLSLLQASFLCFLSLGSPEELRDLMHFGLFCAALGIAALATRKRGGRSPYDPAARNLLRKQQFGHGSSPVQAVFSPSDLSLHFDQGPEPIQKLSYDCFECVIETQDLLLPVRDGRVIVLQKKDLPAGALPELRESLREQVLYMAVVPTAAHR